MIENVDDGVRAGAAVADAPVVGWATGPLGAVQAADREIARQTAVRARAVAAFAASRPVGVDRQQGERGAMSAERWAARPEVLREVSEWATPELAIALNLSQQGAEVLLEESLTLVRRLPGTLAALEAEVLHRGHVWHLVDKVAPVADATQRAEIEADLMTWVAGRNRVTSPSQLGDKARRLVAQRDASAAARRLVRALEERGISLRPERADGMAAVTVVCTMPEARALYAALVQCADALTDEPGGPVRTRGQKMVDALLDLVLRPGEGDLPPVRVLLTIVASVATMLGGDAPAEVDGELVPAEMARQLVRAFAGHDPRPAADPATAASALTDADVSVGDAFDELDVVRDAPATPVDTVGGPVERAAAALSAADFDRWLDDLVRRGFGDAPAAVPDETGRAPADDPPPADPSPAGPPPDVGPPPDAGWWPVADRAVTEAGAAVHAARLALGSAQRAVRSAQVVEAAGTAAWRAGPAGRVDAAPDAITALAAAAEAQRAELAELLATTAGGGLADRPRIVLADALTGAMRTLTELPGCGGRRTAAPGPAGAARRAAATTSPAGPG